MATDIAGARMLLQVPKDATKKDIEKAFRNLSMKLHPDKVTDPNKTLETNERFAEAFNAKDLLLRYLQHLEKKAKVLSPSSCSNVPNADPPIPRKKARQSTRSAPRDKENKPYSAPYSAEEERKQEDEFKEAWRKVAEMLAREKGVPYEKKDSSCNAEKVYAEDREIARQHREADKAMYAREKETQRREAAAWEIRKKEILEEWRKKDEETRILQEELLRKAKADEIIRAQDLKQKEEKRCRKEAEKELNRLRTLKPDYVEEMLLQSSVPVDEVEDSLPPRKKTVNKHRIIQDDSSDESCSNCDSATPSKNSGAGGNGGQRPSSKSYVKSCAGKDFSHGDGSNGGGRLPARSIDSGGESSNNFSNGSRASPPSGGSNGHGNGRGNDRRNYGGGGNSGAAFWSSSSREETKKRKFDQQSDERNNKWPKQFQTSSPSGHNSTRQYYPPYNRHVSPNNNRGYYNAPLGDGQANHGTPPGYYHGPPGGQACGSTPTAVSTKSGWHTAYNNGQPNVEQHAYAAPPTPPLVRSPAKNCNRWNPNNNKWGSTNDNFKGKEWALDRRPVFYPLIPPVFNDNIEPRSQLQVPINEGLRDKIYHQLSNVCGDDTSQLERYVPTEILSLTQQEEEQWDAKKEDAAKYAIQCVIELMKENFGDDDEVDSDEVEDIKDFFTCLKGNFVFDIGFRVDHGNNAIKCLCPCW
jgi:curved DNA-binding protein CbpA